MCKNDFCHLHNHSSFSLLDGIATPESMIRRAKELGHSHVAITDHGVMYGVVDFVKAGRDKDVTPIIGMEAYLVVDIGDASMFRYHITLLAMNPEGWGSLRDLHTESYLRGLHGKPRIDFDMLERHNAGLVCMTGCIAGIICQNLIEFGYQDDKVQNLMRKFISIFDHERLFVEMMYHGAAMNPSTGDREDIVMEYIQDEDRVVTNTAINQMLFLLAEQHDLRTVATNDCHYLWPDDGMAQDAVFATSLGTGINDAHRSLRFAGTDFGAYPFYMKSGKEMREVPFLSIDSFGGGYNDRAAAAHVKKAKIPRDEWTDMWWRSCDMTVDIAKMCSDGHLGIELGRSTVMPKFEIPENPEFDRWLVNQGKLTACSDARSLKGKRRSASMVR